MDLFENKLDVSLGSSPQQNTEAPSSSPIQSNVESMARSSRTRAKSKQDTAQSDNESLKTPQTAITSNGAITKEEHLECDPSKLEEKSTEMLSTCMRYPIVKLAKLSNEDQQQIMESLSKFAENKPKLAKELGIVPEIVKDENVKMEDVKKKDENWYV